eukprot:gnl/MRDRNA2_/MRDRNA2_44679_c0_seq1.p1 gnl/MRDRNA2_/MRDRNA2_44679_c0~~gnl/MRDRNA2_/MRDRNA2_44679_c0_seq1.p1  ORF type:complete len:336 (-),score=60.11 gnl/MRDRNA2_/MRDRNA2_44679_c0_seq1:14-898(-)
MAPVTNGKCEAKVPLLNAREAFSNGDIEASKAYHDNRDRRSKDTNGEKIEHIEPTLPEAKYVRPAVFGGLDGLSTMFALVAGAYGAELSEIHTLALGAAQLVAGAVSMGAGEYLSSKADNEVALREQARERWEVENYPEGEIQEMIEIYKAKGLSQEDAELVGRTLSKYEDFWVEHMMLTEIGILPPETEGVLVNGVLMFVSFLLFGFLPVISYIGSLQLGLEFVQAFTVCCVVSCMGLFGLGSAKAFLADLSIIRGGFSMLAQGSLAGTLSYALGLGIPLIFAGTQSSDPTSF